MATSQAATGLIQTNTNPVRIGGNVPYGEYFNGRIDEVRIYNRALSQAEIQTDMNTPLDTTPPAAPANRGTGIISTSQINLNWTASTDNIAVTGYKVERCQGPGCANFVQVGTSTSISYSDTGLQAGTSCSYRVRPPMPLPISAVIRIPRQPRQAPRPQGILQQRRRAEVRSI